MSTEFGVNHDGIQIREITEADIPDFRACLDAVTRERRYMPLLQAPPLEQTRKIVLGIIERGGIHLVALDGADLIGWADVRPNPLVGLDHAGQLGIGVRKAYRGRGIGHALLRNVLREARERGLEKVELEVLASNTRAIALYEQEGFAVEGRKRRARKLDGKYDDIVLMALFFDQQVEQ